MQEPISPTKDLTSKEASTYLDLVVDYNTFLLGDEIREYEIKKQRYENSVFA